jgi:glycosyltransferase involved in cell wall biosynthesis
MPACLSSDPPAAFITVVMPVRNESRFIGDTLAQILNQEYPPDRFEVIVADGMSDDGTPKIVQEIAGRHPQVRLLENPKRRSSAGRNIGFRNGRGDLFLVVDGHCHIPDRKLLWNLAEAFRKSGADCLGRPQPLDPPGIMAFQKAVAAARGSWLGHSGDSLIYSGFEGFCSPVSNGAAYLRKVFDKVGYVDETFDAAEDVEFNYRVEKAGMRCYTSPALEVKYYPRENVLGLARQMMRYGIGRARFVRKHPEVLNADALIPPMFLLGLMTAPISLFLYIIVRHPALAFLPLVYFGYLLLVLIHAARIRIKTTGIRFFHLIVIFPTIHASLGFGFVMGRVFPTGRSFAGGFIL